MHTVMGPYGQFFDMIRDFDPGEASREWPFVDVRMVQDSGLKYVAVVINDLPAVCIMFLTGVPVRDRHREVVDTLALCIDSDLDNVGFPGEGGHILASQACNEQDRFSDHRIYHL